MIGETVNTVILIKPVTDRGIASSPSFVGEINSSLSYNVHTWIPIRRETSTVRNSYRLLTFLVLCCSAVALPAETLVFKNANIVDATGQPVQMFMPVLARRWR